MSWGDLLGVLAFIAFVVLMWNIHHLTRWFRTHLIEGSIAEGSWLFDGPRWMENPWIGRGLAILAVLLMGLAILDGS